MVDSVAFARQARIHKRTCKLMGNMFSFSIVHDDEGWANHCIDKAVDEIKRVESLLTTFREDSQTNRVNDAAGVTGVVVDREVFELIRRSIRISQLTQGAFDITYGSVDKRLWNFDTGMTSLPDPAVAKRMVHLIDYKNIQLNDADGSVFLKNKGMRIGFGGIGKGYAADRGKKILIDLGIESGVVNASGDLVAWGTQIGGQPWTIGIADPDTRTPFTSLPLSGMAIATSGNYEKFAMVNGKRYSHTIDPKTGLPVTGIKSVSVISPMAELSDALATPVMVMGVQAGLDMINQVKGVACILIDDRNRIFTSNNISLH
ncbi:MAG TPA: FAD:protein FMN transferase [Chryseosolibacter sp.]